MCVRSTFLVMSKRSRGNHFVFQLFPRERERDFITRRTEKYPCSQRDGEKNTSVLDHGIMFVEKRIIKYIIYTYIFINGCNCRVRG